MSSAFERGVPMTHLAGVLADVDHQPALAVGGGVGVACGPDPPIDRGALPRGSGSASMPKPRMKARGSGIPLVAAPCGKAAWPRPAPASAWKPASRSPKRASASQPRCIASVVRLRALSRPLPWRTVSLRYSVRWIWPWSTCPISSRKLLEPRSTACEAGAVLHVGPMEGGERAGPDRSAAAARTILPPPGSELREARRAA